ncbi:poly-beta-hydroxybutyrate-responsive repressor [Scopulibacillus daqui]|uniref:Poly-beta-hydroxybutyrate-responsive repressor n=1 Tax=Scopulibacillus daqui TaxID=1469162 RepID=A0ABS2Q3U4_9BACL|nr:poly-beta-hydroxybutyrate-responsive repressor [Scopulibacillus daqui]MBM7646967.1 poly-beta-hydroxybutyrate-responsive repressor [Scopulibacillus daqui]
MSKNEKIHADHSPLNDDKVMNSTQKNLLIPVLLLTLRGWNLHGYKLIQQLSQFGFSSIDQGNIYRTLRQLEKDNMVKSEWDTSAGGPAKRIYSLTDAGEAYLKAWADSLEQYQSMLNRFFQMYTDMFLKHPWSSHDDNDNDKEK